MKLSRKLDCFFELKMTAKSACQSNQKIMRKGAPKNQQIRIFVSTVLATLPIRTASQGESFAFKRFLTQNNIPSTPLFDAHLGGFFILRHSVN